MEVKWCFLGAVVWNSFQFIDIALSRNKCRLRAPYKKQPIYESQPILLNLQFFAVSQQSLLLYYCVHVEFMFAAAGSDVHLSILYA